jgi:hypothetical protein
VMAEAVHLLPFNVREACEQVEITKRMKLHMYEIVSNSNQRIDWKATEDG